MEGEGIDTCSTSSGSLGPSLGCRRHETLSPPSRVLGLLGPQDSSNSLLTLPPTPRAPPLLFPGLLPLKRHWVLTVALKVSRSKEGPHQGQVVRPGSGGLTLTEDTFKMGRSTEGSANPMSPGLAPTRPLPRTLGKRPIGSG